MTLAIKTDAKIQATTTEVRGDLVVAGQDASQQESSQGQGGLFSEILQDLTAAIDALNTGNESSGDENLGNVEQTAQPLDSAANDAKKDAVGSEDTSSQAQDAPAVQVSGSTVPSIQPIDHPKENILVTDQALNIAENQQMSVGLTDGNAFQANNLNPAFARQRAKAPSALDLTLGGIQARAVETSKTPALQDDAHATAAVATNVAGVAALLQTETKNTLVGRNEGALISSSLPPIALNMPADKSDSASVSTLKLPSGSPTEWRQSLMEALGDRIQIGVSQRSEQATIRLDPPMLGSVEIVIRHQAGSLQVQLSASNGEVVRQLQQLSDSLRQELTQKQFTGVSVQVANHQPGREGQRQQYSAQKEDEPFRAWGDEASNTAKFALNT